MRFGILWFLHLYYVVFISRVSIIPLIILGINLPIRGTLFPIVWVLCGLAVVITLLTFPLRIPSAEAMKKFMDGIEADFIHSVESEYGKKRGFTLCLLKGYTYGKIKLENKIDGRPVYSCFTVTALVQSSDGVWLISRTKSLLSAKPHEQACVKLADDESFTVLGEKYDPSAAINRLRIGYGETEIEMYARADYHYDDFIKALKSVGACDLSRP